MARDKGRIKYHYGFYAAMKVEYALMNAKLDYDQEVQLGEEPIRVDFLIIKKNARVVLTDPIGEYFEAVNIFEYKSPEDSLSIDDFYKAVAYAFIYKGYNKNTNELHIEDMTLTLVRHTYPQKLMKALKKYGFTIDEQHPGIYRIGGITGLKIQFIVSSKLPDENYDGLKLIARGCKGDAVIRYMDKTANSGDSNVKTNAGTVLEMCLNINKNLDEQIGGKMRTIREIFKDAFDETRQEGRQEGRNEAYESVAADMLRKNLPLSLIEEISKLSEPAIRNLAASLGLKVV
ncbi:MAG: hypothetical protein IJG51_10275 [Synergistaceae bacterium]|nr:hypothetical protein [Synergistaceae bacterium]MBQ4401306.1 hypothetical protein [Synergistaceae bacterium]